MLITPGCDRVDRMMFISYNRQNPGLRKTFETFNTLKKPPAMSLSLPSPPQFKASVQKITHVKNP